MFDRRRAVVWAALLGVPIGLAVESARYGEALSYLSDDPKACLNCHVMRDPWNAWAHGPHARHATCNDCHVPQDLLGRYTTKAVHGWRHSQAFTLDRVPEPIRARPDSVAAIQANCVRCHAAALHDLPGGVPAASCTHCHPGAGHGHR
jgi:cytochrome c nitrite reductase small subunit